MSTTGAAYHREIVISQAMRVVQVRIAEQLGTLGGDSEAEHEIAKANDAIEEAMVDWVIEKYPNARLES